MCHSSANLPTQMCFPWHLVGAGWPGTCGIKENCVLLWLKPTTELKPCWLFGARATFFFTTGWVVVQLLFASLVGFRCPGFWNDIKSGRSQCRFGIPKVTIKLSWVGRLWRKFNVGVRRFLWVEQNYNQSKTIGTWNLYNCIWWHSETFGSATTETSSWSCWDQHL